MSYNNEKNHPSLVATETNKETLKTAERTGLIGTNKETQV
jgi:hypothetical protein